METYVDIPRIIKMVIVYFIVSLDKFGVNIF